MEKLKWYKRLSPVKKLLVQLCCWFVFSFLIRYLLNFAFYEKEEQPRLAMQVTSAAFMAIAFVVLTQDKLFREIFFKKKPTQNE
ncbi:MAG: hypothetical protein JST81_06485 [Bacteroidetes bacterium]|jgi:hypothetical protein|nr:hypothetical protein [Bacteroidota bacterium]